MSRYNAGLWLNFGQGERQEPHEKKGGTLMSEVRMKYDEYSIY